MTTTGCTPEEREGLNDWRCRDCGSRTHARIDIQLADGTFGPGPRVRCVGCKEDFELFLPRTALQAAQHRQQDVAGMRKLSVAEECGLEALREFVRMEKSIMTDIGTAHDRGPAASSHMREDDRDMRADLRHAFGCARAALTAAQGSANGEDENAG